MISPRALRFIFVSSGVLLLVLACIDVYRGRLHGWSGHLWLLRSRDPLKFWVAALFLMSLLVGWIALAVLYTG